MSNPLVSYCLVTYNQEKYIRDAIQSAFDQNYDNLEIIISDDCSSDRTPEIIDEMVANYHGPHKVIVNKNNPNLGIREHFNKIWYEIANGSFFLLAGGDDVSDPLRTKIYIEYFERFPEIMSISCKSMQVNEELNPLYPGENWNNTYSIYTIDDYIGFSDFFNLSGDSRGFRRDIIEKFEPLKYSKSEDISTFVRSLMLGPTCYIRKPLVKRRIHNFNASKSKSSSHEPLKKQFFADLKYAKENNYITEKQYNELTKKINYIIDTFDLYQSPISIKKPKVVFYRLLVKLFNVRKVRN